MFLLKRLWQDIRRGENIDLFVTVVIAIGLAILNLLGLAPATWIGPLTLAVLGLLAVATLGNRYKLEESVKRLNQNHAGLFQETMPDSLAQELEQAQELWLVGVTLSRTTNTYYNILESKLARGNTIRVLLVHPDGYGVKMLALREYKRHSVARIRHLIQSSLEDLCGLRQRFPNLEIRVIDYPFGFGGVLVNPGSPGGRLYLEHYPFKVPGGSLPKFTLEVGDGRWYNFFKQEVETIWQSSIPWPCQATSQETTRHE